MTGWSCPSRLASGFSMESHTDVIQALLFNPKRLNKVTKKINSYAHEDRLIGCCTKKQRS